MVIRDETRRALMRRAAIVAAFAQARHGGCE